MRGLILGVCYLDGPRGILKDIYQILKENHDILEEILEIIKDFVDFLKDAPWATKIAYS